MLRFWNNLHQVRSKSNDLKLFGIKRFLGSRIPRPFDIFKLFLDTDSASWCIYYKNVFFTSSECKDNIRVTNKLLSGYHHGRGNIKPASKYLT
jgi:hypothetical protein